MNPPCESSGAAPARGPGPSPARASDEPSAVELERERVRDPDALPAERASPEPAERAAGQLEPLTPHHAEENWRRLADAAREADQRPAANQRMARVITPIPALAAPTKRTSLSSGRPACTGGEKLTSTT